MKLTQLGSICAAAVLASPNLCDAGPARTPYDVVHLDDDSVAAVDSSTVRWTGKTVRYEIVTIMRIPPELEGAPDEVHHFKETDCKAGSTRLLNMTLRIGAGPLARPPWFEGEQEPTEIDPAERQRFCDSGRHLGTLFGLETLRKSLEARARWRATRPNN